MATNNQDLMQTPAMQSKAVGIHQVRHPNKLTTKGRITQ